MKYLKKRKYLQQMLLSLVSGGVKEIEIPDGSKVFKDLEKVEPQFAVDPVFEVTSLKGKAHYIRTYKNSFQSKCEKDCFVLTRQPLIKFNPYKD